MLLVFFPERTGPGEGENQGFLECEPLISGLTSLVRLQGSQGFAFSSSQDEWLAGATVYFGVGAVSPSSEWANI